MLEIGRLCVKIAGRDAGQKCIIVDILEKNYVLIDGITRRRKCNIAHLEPLKEIIKIKKNANHEEVTKALKPLGLEVKTTKPKKSSIRPKKTKMIKKSVKEKAEKDVKKVKKSVKEKELAKTETKPKEPIKKDHKITKTN